MKNMRKICTFLLAMLLVLNMGITAQAAGSVTYNGDSNKFFFAPGTTHSPTSLFENFLGVMPGDTLSEQIQIRNATSNGVKIKVYMRSLGAQEGTDEFLKQMNLTVKQVGDSVLYAAPANTAAPEEDWFYLGTVYSGGVITLDVTLEVPITMGNEFQNQIGYLDWEFKVEELPIDPSDPTPPKTGDTSNIQLYAVLLPVSLLALLLILLIGRKKRRKDEE